MRKKLLFLLIAALLLIALPVVLLLTRQQQDTRSRANATDNVVLYFHPGTASVAPTSDISVDILMNTNGKPVNSLEFSLTYDKDLLELKTVTNGTSFDSIFNNEPNNTTGVYVYAGTGKAHQDVSGSAVKIVTLLFSTKTATSSNNTAELGFAEIKAGAAGEEEPIRHTTSFNAGELTIEANNACSSENSKPLGCACADDSACESGACDAGFCVAGQPSETCESLPDRPDGCSCTEDAECASGVCGDEDTCELAPDPTATPTPTTTPSPTPTTGVIPTATIYPTPTTNPLDPKINFTVTLPGLTDSPIHPQILGPYNMYDASNALVLNGSALLTLDPTAGSGVFKGTSSIGDGVPLDTTKTYLISIKTDNTLSERSSGIVSFSTGTPPTANASFTMIFGDINADNELSILDYSLFIECIQKNICADDNGKKRADFNDDGKVDALDLNLLYTGFASRKGE